eukprot:m.1359073 g.1359073  ORF g.1359073 m.1359073 type:complete len:306 (+) comp24937_c0_seq5:586-1503(+)
MLSCDKLCWDLFARTIIKAIPFVSVFAICNVVPTTHDTQMDRHAADIVQARASWVGVESLPTTSSNSTASAQCSLVSVPTGHRTRHTECGSSFSMSGMPRAVSPADSVGCVAASSAASSIPQALRARVVAQGAPIATVGAPCGALSFALASAVVSAVGISVVVVSFGSVSFISSAGAIIVSSTISAVISSATASISSVAVVSVASMSSATVSVVTSAVDVVFVAVNVVSGAIVVFVVVVSMSVVSVAANSVETPAPPLSSVETDGVAATNRGGGRCSNTLKPSSGKLTWRCDLIHDEFTIWKRLR